MNQNQRPATFTPAPAKPPKAKVISRTFALRPSDLEWINLEARRLDLSESALVRIAIDELKAKSQEMAQPA